MFPVSMGRFETPCIAAFLPVIRPQQLWLSPKHPLLPHENGERIPNCDHLQKTTAGDRPQELNTTWGYEGIYFSCMKQPCALSGTPMPLSLLPGVLWRTFHCSGEPVGHEEQTLASCSTHWPYPAEFHLIPNVARIHFWEMSAWHHGIELCWQRDAIGWRMPANCAPAWIAWRPVLIGHFSHRNLLFCNIRTQTKIKTNEKIAWNIYISWKKRQCFRFLTWHSRDERRFVYLETQLREFGFCSMLLEIIKGGGWIALIW